MINKQEFGQGVYTSMAMLVAEELDCDWTRVRAQHAPAARVYASPTFGIQMTGESDWAKPAPRGRARGGAVHESANTVCAHVVEVSVQDSNVRAHRVTSAIDCGLAVNPLGVEAQVQSAMVYGLSATLYGRITLANGRVEQGNFNDCPVLRIDEMPQMSLHIVPSTAAPTGVGEPGTPPIAPAVANAIAAATGKRLRDLPFDLTA